MRGCNAVSRRCRDSCRVNPQPRHTAHEELELNSFILFRVSTELIMVTIRYIRYSFPGRCSGSNNSAMERKRGFNRCPDDLSNLAAQ
jgi:hypothetical protein